MVKKMFTLVIMMLAVAVLTAQTIYAKPPADAGSCGNGKCNGQETCSTCPQDCGVCAPVCGNGICESGEGSFNCPADCGGANWSSIERIATEEIAWFDINDQQ